MSHHADEPFDGPDFQKRQELMRSLLSTTEFRGAIGAFPEGRLSEADEGNIQFAIGEANGKVVIDLGTSVHWMGMTPQQAADLASALLRKAREVGRKNGETITMSVGG